MVSLFLFVPSIQRFTSQKVANYLENTIGTEVSLEGIYLNFPNGVSIEELYLEDQTTDTLLYVGNFEVSIDYFALLHAEIEISDIILEEASVNISVKQDSSFNFDYIIDAFTGNSSATSSNDTSQSTIDIDIGSILLNNVGFSYFSEVDGMKTAYKIGELSVISEDFDLEQQTYVAERIELSNTSGSFEFFKEVVSSTTSDSEPLQMIVGTRELIINDVDFKFKNKPSNQFLDTRIGNLIIEAKPIQLANQDIQFDKISIDSSFVRFDMQSDTTSKEENLLESSGEKENIWKISLNDLAVNSFDFNYNDNLYPQTKEGIDYSHLRLKVKTLGLEHFYFEGTEDISTQLKELSLSDKSGFKINKGAFNFKMTSTEISVEDLLLKTNNSFINTNTLLHFNSLEDIPKNLGELEVNSKFNQSIISLKDLKYFAPEVLKDSNLIPYRDRSFQLYGSINGAINNLNFKKFIITTAKKTQLSLNGTIKGLPETNDLAFNLSPLIIKTSDSDVTKLLPPNTIPPSIQLPQNMRLLVKGKGNMNQLAAKIELNTDYGNLTSDIRFNRPKDATKPSTYELNANLPSFDLASLLKDSLLGNLGFEGKVDGSGLSLDVMKIDLDAKIKDFNYQNYQYSDLIIKGRLKEEFFDGELHMNDSNLIFDFNGKAKLDSILPEYDFNFDLKGVDLQHLGFTKEDLRINGGITVDMSGNNLENLNGNAGIRNVLIIYKGEQYRVDSLLFLSVIDSGRTDISITSTLIDASFKGNIYLSDLGTTLQNHFARYLDQTTNTSNTKAQDFEFEIKLKDPDLLTEVILPDLNRFETGLIKGSFNSIEDRLKLDINLPLVDYSNILIDSLSLQAYSDSSELNANLSIDQISYDTLGISNIFLNNQIKNDSAIINFKIVDDSSEVQLQLMGGISKKDKKQYQFRFYENEQILNREEWRINPKNKISFGDTLRFDSLIFKNENQLFSFQSKEEKLVASFDNFQLESIFTLISSYQEETRNFGLILREKSVESKLQDSLKAEETPILSGTLNGVLNFPTVEHAELNGNLQIDQLQVVGISLGKLNATANSSEEKDSIQLTLRGDKNSLSADGWMKEDQLDFRLKIDQLQVETIEAFSGGQLTSSKGNINGEASIKGTIEQHVLKGKLNFNSVSFRSQYLGETYHLPDESLDFKNEILQFNDFTVLDSSNQKFSIKGNVGLQDFNNPKFDLTIDCNDFQFLNTNQESKNDLFYGQVLITADIKVKGDMNRPKINADVQLEEGTDLTFVVPSEEVVTVDREGIVEFVDKDEQIPALLREKKDFDTVKVDILGLDLSSLIDIDKETKVTIIIDPITGDRLLVQGGGKIRADLDPAGNVNMNGVYEIKEGNYELRLYNLVRRQFELETGSKLVWNGDPLEAQMDIRGIYTAKAAPIGLLGNQISNLSEAERNQYQKKLPFKVILNLGGEIMKPEIGFKLDLPNDEKGGLGGAVMAKLNEINQDESELNKQVFSLIVLKRFFSQDPFGSGGGGSYAARQSVSQLLNQQLNSITDKYIKGVAVELNVDSYEDYTESGELQGRTELNLALSKNLFNDRVVVKVDGNIDVENTEQSGNNAVAGDVSVTYKITEDGRYRVKIYRDNRYEGLIEGEFVETGVALIYTREYELFKELFRKPENVTLEKDD